MEWLTRWGRIKIADGRRYRARQPGFSYSTENISVYVSRYSVSNGCQTHSNRIREAVSWRTQKCIALISIVAARIGNACYICNFRYASTFEKNLELKREDPGIGSWDFLVAQVAKDVGCKKQWLLIILNISPTFATFQGRENLELKKKKNLKIGMEFYYRYNKIILKSQLRKFGIKKKEIVRNRNRILEFYRGDCESIE